MSSPVDPRGWLLVLREKGESRGCGSDIPGTPAAIELPAFAQICQHFLVCQKKKKETAMMGARRGKR